VLSLTNSLSLTTSTTSAGSGSGNATVTTSPSPSLAQVVKGAGSRSGVALGASFAAFGGLVLGVAVL
jgi:hypothetical protein